MYEPQPKKDENELTINQKDIEKKTRKPLDKTRAAVFHDKRTKFRPSLKIRVF